MKGYEEQGDNLAGETVAAFGGRSVVKCLTNEEYPN